MIMKNCGLNHEYEYSENIVQLLCWSSVSFVLTCHLVKFISQCKIQLCPNSCCSCCRRKATNWIILAYTKTLMKLPNSLCRFSTKSKWNVILVYLGISDIAVSITDSILFVTTFFVPLVLVCDCIIEKMTFFMKTIKVVVIQNRRRTRYFFFSAKKSNIEYIYLS